MTAFRIPEHVEARAAARLTAHRTADPCSCDGQHCDLPATHRASSVGGAWSDQCWPRVQKQRGMWTGPGTRKAST